MKEIYQVNNFEGYTYDIKKDDRVKTPEELHNFFNEIDANCKKYDFSISHEDTEGGFTITRYDEKLARWLKAASKDY